MFVAGGRKVTLITLQSSLPASIITPLYLLIPLARAPLLSKTRDIIQTLIRNEAMLIALFWEFSPPNSS